MLETISNNIGIIISTIVAISSLFTLFNEKAREFILRKTNIKKSVSEIRKETIQYDDISLDVLTKRIEAITVDYVKQMETTSNAVKEKYEYKLEVERMKVANDILKEKIDRNCINSCLLP
jgi:hypothetical protein